VAVDAGDERAETWLTQLDGLAARHGFRELQVRSHLHKARLGDPDAWNLASLLAGEIDNPLLAQDVDRHQP
jgi:hypothetical protein